LGRLRVVCGLSVLLACSSWGDVIQTQDFDYTLSNQPSGPYTVVNDFFMNNVAPFDPSLGQLTGFSVDWNITFNIGGITSAVGSALTESVGGVYSLGGIGYFGFGGENGTAGDEAGTPLSLPPLPIGNGFSFPVPDNQDYDPALLAVVTGSSDFSLEWASPFDISVAGMASWTAEASGFVTITYDYVPEPSAFIPMLGGLGVFALVRRRRFFGAAI